MGAVRKRTRHGLAGSGHVVEADELHPVEDVLVGRQAVQHQLAGKVALGNNVQRLHLHGIGEVFGGGPLHHHPRGPVGPGPDHAGRTADIARLQSVRYQRPVSRPADRRCKQAAAARLADAAAPVLRMVRRETDL
jgi:hypothetical protein